MAPSKTVHQRADIWAFGVVLHELLTGRKPFTDETVCDTLAAVFKDLIDVAIPQANSPIQALLRRCLSRNRKHRLKDIGEAVGGGSRGVMPSPNYPFSMRSSRGSPGSPGNSSLSLTGNPLLQLSQSTPMRWYTQAHHF